MKSRSYGRIKQTLASLILDHLRVHKTASYEELQEIALKNKYKPETFTRLFREDERENARGFAGYPVVKLNSRKKLLKEGERVWYYRYIGKTMWHKKLVIK